MASKDIRLMTITELGQLAEAIRTEPSGSRNYKRLRDQMCAASLYLEDSGALQQLLWWAKDTVMEAPPEARGKLFVMSSPQMDRRVQTGGQ